MAIVFALPALLQAVVDRFAVEGPWLVAPVIAPPAPGIPIPNVFGWKKPEQQMLRGNRVIWVPGDDDNGDVGEYLSPRQVGQNPRSLARLGELFTIYIVGEDKTQPENEIAQYNATRALHDAWFRAVHLAAYGTFKLNKPRWFGEAKERRRGATMRLVGTIEAPLPDEIHDFVAADAHAEVGVALHADFDDEDEEETVNTTEEAP
jgi:hypothetical protein